MEDPFSLLALVLNPPEPAPDDRKPSLLDMNLPLDELSMDPRLVWLLLPLGAESSAFDFDLLEDVLLMLFSSLSMSNREKEFLDTPVFVLLLELSLE